MAEQTVGDRVAEYASKGLTSEQIATKFKDTFGLELKQVPKDMSMSTLQTMAKVLPTKVEFKGSAAAPAKPEPSMLERAANWAGGLATGLPSLAAGAVSSLPTLPGAHYGGPGGVPTAGFEPITDVNESIAMDKAAAVENQRRIDQMKMAAEQAAKLRANRANMPTSRTLLADVGDVVSGLGRLFVGQGLNLEGPANEPPLETAKRRFEQGREMGAGLVGGTADIAKGLVTEPWSTNPARTQPVTTAMTVVPMAKGANLALRAGGEAATRAGGTVGRIGSAVAEATRATDVFGERLHAAGEWTKEKLAKFPGSEELLNKLQEDVQNGVITPKEAAKIMQDHTPWQSRFVESTLPQTVRPALETAGRVGKGALYGAVLGDTVVGPVAGALLGAAGAGGLELARKVSPAKYGRLRAAYRRNVVDPAAQETPAQTEIMRSIVEEPVRRSSEVQTLTEEAAGRLGQGQVEFDVSSKPQKTAAPMYDRLTFRSMEPERGLVPLQEESLARELIGEQAVGEGRFLDVLQKRKDSRAEQLAKDIEQRPQGESWPTALDIEARLKEPGAGDSIPSKTTSTAFNKVVDQVGKAMTAAGQEVNPEWFHRALTSSLDETSTAMGYSPRFRKIVAMEAANFMQISPKSKAYKPFIAAVDNKLVELARESLGPTPKSFTLVNEAGQEMRLNDLQVDAVRAIERSSRMPAPPWYKIDRRLPPMEELRADITQRLGRTLRMQTEDTHLAHAIDRERQRFIAPASPSSKTNVINPSGVKDPATYAINIADRVAQGEPMPLMTVYDPKEMAARLRQVADTGLVPVGRSVGEITALAEHLESMKPVSAELAQYMGDQKQLAMIGDSPGTGMWATAGTDAALTARVKLLQVARNADVLDRMLNQFKVSMTALRAKTWVNNIGSNVVMQSLRLGKLPTQVIAEAAEAAKGMLQYQRDPKSLPREQVQMYRSLAHGGLSSLAKLEGDFNALTALSSAQGVVGGAVHHTLELAKKGYGYGDMPFKVMESVNRYRQTMSDLSQLKDGEWVRLRLSGDSAVDLRKVPQGFEANGKFVPEQQLSNLVGRAAVTFAQDSFINTAHAPVWLQKLHSGRYINIASPFLAWAWGALELPGKQGLLRRALFFDGNSMVDTNNPALLARNSARALYLGAMRDALIKSTMSSLHSERDEIRRVFPYAFGNEGAVDIQPKKDDPFAVSAHDFGPMNPFSRAALVWRLGQSAIGNLYGVTGAPGSQPWKEPPTEEMDPQRRRRAEFFTDLRSKQVATVKDALDAASLAGNMFIDLARDMEQASAPNAKIDPSDVLAKFVVNLIGGSAVDVAKVAYGTAVDPMEKMAGRPWRYTGEKAGPGDAGQWAVQTLLGIGYMDKELYGQRGKIASYLRRFEAALQHSIEKDHDDRIEKIATNSTLSENERTSQLEKLNAAQADAKAWVSQAVGKAKTKLYESAMEFSGVTQKEAEAVLEEQEKSNAAP